MRQIIDYFELIHDECFIAWFLMNNFPEGIDVSNDCSMARMIAENCVIDKVWVDKLTGYYEGVFDESDGYIENPKTVEICLFSGTLFFVEFHPGDTLYYADREMIGCTGPDYIIRKIEFIQFVELTKEMGDKEKIFLLPMLRVQSREKVPAEKMILSILKNYKLQECSMEKICECIMENCVEP